MNNTNNNYEKDTYKAGEGSRMSQNVQQEFVNKELWEKFRKRFKSNTTEASYRSDISELCRFCGKNLKDADRGDVERYYAFMKNKMDSGRISPLTVTKKFRELHSFLKFAADETGDEAEYRDYFYPYLKNMEKERGLARSIPVEDMDALLEAASDDLMAYTILTLMYRAGISSTEIAGLNGAEDFALYGDEGYVLLSGREEPCYIPEDAWEILMKYMDQRDEHPSLFYNRSGRRLNIMYISRMMKRYCRKAGIENYSAEAVRNCCAFNLFSYGASPKQVADQMGRTQQQIRRYRGMSYRGNLRRQADELVKIRIESP